MIAVQWFAPAEGGKHPALVVLHAVDGVEGACAPLYQNLGREYARRGYILLLVHYFDRTGTEKEDREAYRELFLNYFSRRERAPDVAAKIRELFGAWVDTVGDAVRYARTQPEVDGDRVGLVGFSLGASLALAAASRNDLKLAAVVEFFGALPRELHPGLRKMPPTLIFHGEADRIVPVEEAYLLTGVLLARNLQPEVEVYAGVDHMFFKDGTELQALPLLQARRRADAFLQKHLKPRVVAERGEKQ
jgi:carboxymethylenebutenolidase